MKQFILMTICITSLFSCVEIKFEEAQPINTNSLAEFPESMQGKYVEDSNDSIVDTIIITPNYYSELAFIHNDTIPRIKKKKIYLSDSLILKSFENQHIASFKEKDYWFIAIINSSIKNELSVMLIDADNEDLMEEIKRITTVKTVMGENNKVDAYILNPTKSEFKKMLQLKDIFAESTKLKKLQE